MASPSVNVLVAGGINIDRTFAVNRLPVKGETVMGHSGFQGVGGKAANASVACSKFGASTSFLGAFGDDFYTPMLQNELKKYNVDSSCCFNLKNSGIPCGQAYIFLLPDGDNSIIVVAAANRSWPDTFNDKQIEMIKQCDCILLQREVCEEYNIRIVKIAKSANPPVKVILDVGGEDTKISPELLKLVDILSPNETELKRLIKYYDTDGKYMKNTSKYSTIRNLKGSHELLQKYNKNLSILLKRGDRGCIFIDSNNNIITQKALKINQKDIIDTTGAGDCFTGAFMVEYIRQKKLINSWNKPIVNDDDKKNEIDCITNAMKFGNAAAGLSVKKKGTIASIPDLNDVICTVLSEL